MAEHNADCIFLNEDEMATKGSQTFASAKAVEAAITIVKDFPKEGIEFKDITTLLMDPKAFSIAINMMIVCCRSSKAEAIITTEARGFIFAMPIAKKLGLPVVLARKPNKLPRPYLSVNYGLEYGNDTLAVHAEDIQKFNSYLLIDDVLATGGTAKACAELIEKSGGKLIDAVFLEVLDNLQGKSLLEKHSVQIQSIL